MGWGFWISSFGRISPCGLALACFGSGQPPLGGLSLINSVAATLGGFAGPLGWLKEFSGCYIVGRSAVAAIMLPPRRLDVAEAGDFEGGRGSGLSVVATKSV